jgi:hypothetical protein
MIWSTSWILGFIFPPPSTVCHLAALHPVLGPLGISSTVVVRSDRTGGFSHCGSCLHLQFLNQKEEVQ